MITVNNKTVKQPYVAVNGDWKKVSAEYAMVNGEWKEVFSGKETYTVNIYRYGSLYQTLSVTEGESVTLPSLGVGFATASGSTTTAYNSGVTITPTGNMTLYAVFSYSIKIYRFGSLYQTLTSKSQSNNGSFTLPSYGAGYATSSSSTTISYNNGATLSSSGTTLYILYEYSIKLYKYGSLYKTLTSKSQSSTASFTLPTCTVSSGDDAFYGWTKTSGAADKDYDANQTITSSGTSLYAVFSYTSTAQGTQVNILDTYNNRSAFPVTIPTYCTITCIAYNLSVYTGQEGYKTEEKSLDFVSNKTTSDGLANAWFTINGSFRPTSGHTKSAPFSFSTSAGNIIDAGGHITTINHGNGTTKYYPYIEISYPVTITSTLYRSEK